MVEATQEAIDVFVQEILNADRRTPDGRCDPMCTRAIGVFDGPRSWLMEAWIVGFRKRAEVTVDWSLCAGRIVLSCRPDVLSQAADQTTVIELANRWLPALRDAALRVHNEGSNAMLDGYPLVTHSGYPVGL